MSKIEKLLLTIRRHLTDDLLKPKYRKKKNRLPTTGHCYVATEALYHSLSEKMKEKYKPHYVKVYGDTHWFLMTEKVGNSIFILDPTFDQFPRLPNYTKGKRAAFLTKQPSKRTLILLDRIKNGRKFKRRNIHS